MPDVHGLTELQLHTNGRPLELVKQLLAVVGNQEKREIMSIADWYEDRGRQAGLKSGACNLLLRQLRARFGALRPLPKHATRRPTQLSSTHGPIAC